MMKQPLFSYTTIAFIAPVEHVFVLYKCTDGYSHCSIFFHGSSVFWKTLLLSLPNLLDFLTVVLILSTGDCNVDISEQVIYQVNDLVLCRIPMTLPLCIGLPKFFLCTP